MSLLLLFSGAGDEGWSPPKKEVSTEYYERLARLNREDDELLTIMISWVLKDG